MRSLSLISLGTLLLVSSVGCGSDPDPNDPSQFQQGGYQAGQYPPGQYPPGGQQGTVPGQYPTQQAPTATAPAAAGGQAQPLPPAAAALATPALTALASNETRGMQPEGSAFAGNFQQGQTLEQPFNIEPNKCYTVVGVGVGITELDIMIQVGAAPIPPQTIAQDNQTGAQAVVGGGGSCFKNPFPIGAPATVVMRATGGSGIALAQIYKK